MFFSRKKTEVEFLREQVKDLQQQVLLLVNKHSDYINTKIAMNSPLLKETVVKEPQKEVEEIEKPKDFVRELARVALGGE